MKQTLAFLIATLVSAGCSGTSEQPPATSTNRVFSNKVVDPGDGVAYFAGGCFWGVEYFLEKLDGVSDVDSGFMGGTVDSPSYQQVVGKHTGHLETVRVRYHTDKITFNAIAKRFFEIHDPTQANGQGPDIGPQYRSAVFYSTADEKKVAEALIAKLSARGYKVVTELRPVATFWKAEDYHQDYYQRNGKQPYCHMPVPRFDRDAPAK